MMNEKADVTAARRNHSKPKTIVFDSDSGDATSDPSDCWGLDKALQDISREEVVD
jgi:hypothetical protein